MNNFNEGPMKSGGIKSNLGIPRPAQNPKSTSTSSTIEKLETKIKEIYDHPIGRWISASIDDPLVCEEMKKDAISWFDLIHEANLLIEKE